MAVASRVKWRPTTASPIRQSWPGRGALVAIGYNAGMNAMRRFRFRLRTLLLFIVAASFALAAMRFATAAWASAIVTATVLTLLVSIALAVCTSGERRSFWIGFAICGNVYLLGVTESIKLLAPEIVVNLATTRAVAFLRESFHPQRSYMDGQSPKPLLPLLPSQESSQTTSDFYDRWSDGSYHVMAVNFDLIGQSIWALFSARSAGCSFD